MDTTQGRIRTEIVVVATGIWSPRIGHMVGISIPLIPMQHQWAMTAPLSELAGERQCPNLRDPDKLVYFRQDGQGLVIGGYERNPVAFDVDAIPDNDKSHSAALSTMPRFAELDGSEQRARSHLYIMSHW